MATIKIIQRRLTNQSVETEMRVISGQWSVVSGPRDCFIFFLQPMCLGRLYTILHIWWNREFPENSLSKWLTGLSGLILKGGSIDISLCFILWISAQKKSPPPTHIDTDTHREREGGVDPDLISFQYLESCSLVPSFINCQLRGRRPSSMTFNLASILLAA